MMDVRADSLDCLEPKRMNQIEVVGAERRRMGAEVINGRSAGAVMDDQPDVERLRLRDALPRFTEQPG